MRNALDCINAFIPLLSTEYEIMLGRKGVAVTLKISFDKKDCFHLMGLQYLIDRPELGQDRGRVFDKIADGTITIEKIESSDFYNKIEQRVHFLPLFEQMIDSNDTVFKYNKKANMYSKKQASWTLLYKKKTENQHLKLHVKQLIFINRNKSIIFKVFHILNQSVIKRFCFISILFLDKKSNIVNGSFSID